MGAASVARWVVLATLRRGSAWGVLVVLVAFEPLVHGLAPFRIGPRAAGAATAFEVAFLGAVAGAAYALRALAGHGALFRAAGALRRTWAEGVGILAGALLFSVPAVLPALLAGRFSVAPGATSGALGSLLWMHLHLAGIALLALRLAAPASVRIAFLVSSAWVLPILSLSDEGEAGLLATLFGAPLHAQRPAGPFLGAEWTVLASIAVLWWLSALLGQPRHEQR